jgi:hypothetical protein
MGNRNNYVKHSRNANHKAPSISKEQGGEGWEQFRTHTKRVQDQINKSRQILNDRKNKRSNNSN